MTIYNVVLYCNKILCCVSILNSFKNENIFFNAIYAIFGVTTNVPVDKKK